MGQLTLPVTGPVHLDASGFIYSVEHIEPYRAPFEAMWQQALNRQFTIVRSDLVALETLFKPMRDINRAVEAVFRSLSDTDEASSIPTTR